MSKDLTRQLRTLAFPISVGLLGALAVGYVVWAAQMPLLSRETGPPVLGAVLAGSLCVYGLIVVGRALTLYDAEDNALDDTQTALHRLAEVICDSSKLGSKDVDGVGAPERVELILGGKEAVERTPLLTRRLTSLVRAVRRGAPLLETDYARSEDRYFPAPERKVRSLMDIALNTGIAGTFLSLLLTFTNRDTSLTADTLLAHLGPGLISGMAGVFCNVSLRLGHGALIERQDALADRVDWLVAEHFVHLLPKVLTSSEERLADAVRQHVTVLGELLTTQLKEPIGAIKEQVSRLADSAGALEKHSGVWGLTATSMKNDISLLLSENTKQQLKNAKVLDQFVRDYEARATTHQNDLKTWAEELLTEEQEKRLTQNQEIVQSALTAYNKAAETYLTRVTEHVAEMMTGAKEAFAGAVKESLSGALSESATLVDDLRTEAGKLAAHLDQIGKSTERQLAAQRAGVEGWEARATEGQDRWERILTGAQTAQAELMADWQRSAGESLRSIRTALEVAATASREGNEALAGEIAGLQKRVTDIAEPLRQTEQAFTSVGQTLTSASETLKEAETTLTAALARANEHVNGLNGTLKDVSTNLTNVGVTSTSLGEAIGVVRVQTDKLSGVVATLNDQLSTLERTVVEASDERGQVTASAYHTHAAFTTVSEAALKLSSQLHTANEALRTYCEQLTTSPNMPDTVPTDTPDKVPTDTPAISESESTDKADEELRPIPNGVGGLNE